jgi:hypothetical protein
MPEETCEGIAYKGLLAKQCCRRRDAPRLYLMRGTCRSRLRMLQPGSRSDGSGRGQRGQRRSGDPARNTTNEQSWRVLPTHERFIVRRPSLLWRAERGHRHKCAEDTSDQATATGCWNGTDWNGTGSSDSIAGNLTLSVSRSPKGPAAWLVASWAVQSSRSLRAVGDGCGTAHGIVNGLHTD